MPTGRRVKISGIDVTDYSKRFEVIDTFGSEVTKVNLMVKKSITNVITLANTQTLEIFYNATSATITEPDDRIFSGRIEDFKLDRGKYDIFGLDLLAQAGKEEINRVFLNTDAEAGVISEIIKTLITTVGLSYTGASIQDSTIIQGAPVQKFVCRNSNVFERMRKLADALDWQIYINPVDELVYFQDKGTRTAGLTVLTVGQEIAQKIKWNATTEDMINELNIIGVRTLIESTEFFSGNGSNTVFTLLNLPEFTKVFLGAGAGVLQKGGVINVTTNPQYTVDKQTKTINFTIAPPVGVNNVRVEYGYTVPIPLAMRDDASILTYGKYERTITMSDVQSLDDAIARGNQLLALRSVPKFNAEEMRVRITTQVMAGDLVNIIDPFYPVNANFLVVKKRTLWPTGFYNIVAGDQNWENARMQEESIDRIKRLEELSFENSDIVTELAQVGNANQVIKPYTFTVYVQSAGDSFLLGHPENGILGPSRGTYLDRFNGTAANWTSGSLTISNDTIIYIEGGESVQLDWVASGSHLLTSTQSYGDLSSYTGVASGLPSQGTIGLWLNQPVASSISGVQLRIGSSASDYIQQNASIYDSAYGYAFSTANWIYLTFDLDTASVTGTPDWTAVDYTRIDITAVTGTGTIYLDYFTISQSNVIGLNGLGGRLCDQLVAFTQSY